MFEESTLASDASSHPSITLFAYFFFLFLRMKIEVATLKESLESMEHLTSSFHRLRLSLLKVSHHTILFIC